MGRYVKCVRHEVSGHADLVLAAGGGADLQTSLRHLIFLYYLSPGQLKSRRLVL